MYFIKYSKLWVIMKNEEKEPFSLFDNELFLSLLNFVKS